MNVIMLGVGDYGASNRAGDVVKTLALGSCVAVVLLDTRVRAVGMAHVALPNSSISPDRAAQKPGHFADTGIPALFQAMRQAGSGAAARDLMVKLVGGAMIMDPNNTFNIGNRNVLAIKKLLWQYGMGPVAEDVGGQYSRSVAVDVDSGAVQITSPGRGIWTI